MSAWVQHGDLVQGVPGQCMWAVRAKRIMTMQPDRPVLENGMVLCLGERILAVDAMPRLVSDCSCEVLDLGDATIAPGLMNCHAHLELCHLRGLVSGGQGFAAWIKAMLAQGMEAADLSAIEHGVREMRDSGTIFTADVATRHADLTFAAMDRCLHLFHVFVEFIGYPNMTAQADDLPWPKNAAPLLEHSGRSVSAAGHALYSTSGDMLRAAKSWCRQTNHVFSMHLAEHEDEEQSLLAGSGEFHEMLSRSLLPRGHAAPGMRPVALADSLGLLDEQTLAVHCVRLTDQEIDLLAERGVAVCLCPRSNEYIGVGRAPWEKLSRQGIRLCLGTDSLASNHDLVLWNEVRFLLENSASHITLPQALAWMTVNPAQVFGLEASAGTLAPGRMAAMSIVPEDLARL